MKDSARKAMFAKNYNAKPRVEREKLLLNAGSFNTAKYHSPKLFENLSMTEQDMLLHKEGINVNRHVKYPYKLKSKNDPKHPKEPEIHYLERTGQILSSRKWSGRKKHMVHHTTGQDYHE